MRIHVDDKLCTGQGRCYAIAPTMYTPDDDGYCAQRGEEFEAPATAAAAAHAGADACPQAAISVTERIDG